MIIVLSHETIVRILDHATTTSGPALSKSLIDALNKAKQDKASLVGPLEPSEFNALSAWGRGVGLTKEAEIVEAAVRASG